MSTTASYQIRPITGRPAFKRCESGVAVSQCKHEPRCQHFAKLGFGRVASNEPEPLAVFPASLSGLSNAISQAAKLSKAQPVELVAVQVLSTFDGGVKASG